MFIQYNEKSSVNKDVCIVRVYECVAWSVTKTIVFRSCIKLTETSENCFNMTSTKPCTRVVDIIYTKSR